LANVAITKCYERGANNTADIERETTTWYSENKNLVFTKTKGIHPLHFM
jgi:hypothetical protein